VKISDPFSSFFIAKRVFEFDFFDFAEKMKKSSMKTQATQTEPEAVGGGKAVPPPYLSLSPRLSLKVKDVSLYLLYNSYITRSLSTHLIPFTCLK
jgi:hypothetical protein